MRGTVAIVATMDTKGVEMAFLKERIEALGCATLVIDIGVFEPEGIRPDVSRHEIAAAAGSSIPELVAGGQKRRAFETMSEGAGRKIDELYKAGRFQAVVTAAGGTGTHLVSGALQALPIGVPKLIVTTVASRDVSSIIGSKDVTLMHAVCDIIGLNFMSKGLLATAAGAITGMIVPKPVPPADRRAIGLTSFSPLNGCAFSATTGLRGLGYEVVPFHTVGSGSMAMEALIGQGVLRGVLDLSLHEFVDWIHGGYCKSIGPDRLETAGRMEVPHVILPGGLDMAAFECTSLEGVPAHLHDRLFVKHDFRSLIRSSGEDMARIAAMVAEKANRAKRAPTFVLPCRGWSSVDAPGKPFYDPEVNQVFVSGLRSLLGKHVRVVEVDANINDEECAKVAVEEFHREFQRKP
ncbi:MAG: UPF0261 family protein [Acidobacteriales bacterium]|nr:MAG: UPF0261 family protein [Terriglobales bacterium]